MKLLAAQPIAEKIAAALAPFCDRIEIAGSIRRRRDWVNDIDLVVLPKAGQLGALKSRALSRCSVIKDGNENFIVGLSLPGAEVLQIDIFIAKAPEQTLVGTEPGNWGSLLLCRTGSTQHNIHLVQRAKQMRLTWSPYQGVLDGFRVLAWESEQDIFRALNMDYIDPERRER